jgi:hypothetical protein
MIMLKGSRPHEASIWLCQEVGGTYFKGTGTISAGAKIYGEMLGGNNVLEDKGGD